MKTVGTFNVMTLVEIVVFLTKTKKDDAALEKAQVAVGALETLKGVNLLKFTKTFQNGITVELNGGVVSYGYTTPPHLEAQETV